MSEAVRFADLIAHEIGGGWGEETATDASPDAAFVIRGTDIPRALVGDVSTVPYRFHKTSNLRSRALRPLDIVFEVSGGSKGQPVGRALLVSQRLLDTLGAPTMCASFCKLVRLDPQTCDPRFVFRRLQHEYATGGLDSFQVQSTGITNFRWKPFLDQFEVVLPPRSVQERVADVLEAIDDLIENNRRRVEVLEEMARAIYREWFVHFRYPGHEDVPLANSALGSIPRTWGIAELRALAKLEGGSKLTKKDYAPAGYTAFSAAGPDGFLPEFEVDSKGVVLSAVGARCGRTFRASGRWSSIANTIKILPVRDRCSPAWLALSLEDPSIFPKRGSAQPFVSINDARAIPLIAPPSTVMDDFERTVGPTLDLVDALGSSATRLASARDLLLPKLVTGQIDVSRLDLHELVEVASA